MFRRVAQPVGLKEFSILFPFARELRSFTDQNCTVLLVAVTLVSIEIVYKIAHPDNFSGDKIFLENTRERLIAPCMPAYIDSVEQTGPRKVQVQILAFDRGCLPILQKGMFPV